MSTVTRGPKAGDKYLVTGSLTPVEAVARLLAHDRDAAREVLLALGLIEPVKAAPAPKKKVRTAAKPKPRPRRPVDWLCRPQGSKLHAVREGAARAVCGSWLPDRADWRAPTREELDDADRCAGCVGKRARMAGAS